MPLLIGIILGLILMAAIYNGAMYYYNREPSLLYYTLMQLFMAAVLCNVAGVETCNENTSLIQNEIYQALVSLGVAIFAILFTLSFLDIKRYIPKLYNLLRFELLLVGADVLMTSINHSYLLDYNIYPLLILPLLYAGFIRMRQGYLPARYYLAGWILLTLAVFSSLFSWGSLPLDPLYLGAAAEAILFSLALSYKLRLEAQEKEQQRQMLIQQSRLASMGEMLGNIAHQWRQPLNHLSYTFMNLQDAQKHGELDEAYLSKKLEEGNTQLQFMSQTIEDFKGFFAPQKQKEHFSLAEATQETLEIIQNTLQRHQIEIILDIQADTTLYSYKNEYKQALLNLLSNAKDAFIKQNLTNKQITLTLTEDHCTIQDNAGGIDKETLPRIFEPYFSTKEGGLGIGLYMTKIIIEKNMGGSIHVTNQSNGACFEILL